MEPKLDLHKVLYVIRTARRKGRMEGAVVALCLVSASRYAKKYQIVKRDENQDIPEK